jgi:plasmid stabilization system protein ParE
VGRRRRLRWTAPARADVLGAHAFVRALNPAAAAKLLADLLAATDRIGRFPDTGARLRNIPLEGEYRSLVVRNYRIIYTIRPSGIWIARVWDCRQDPDGLWEFFEKKT